MRYKLTITLFILMPICVLGQKDITGVWYGTIIKNGEKNRVIEPKWTINNKEIKIAFINRNGNTNEWNTFNYVSDAKTIRLKSDDGSITFNIISYEEKQLTVYNREDDYLILFKKKDKMEKVEFKIPYDKYFKIITNDDKFAEYKFYFVWFPSNAYILTFKEDIFIDAGRIGLWSDSTFTEIFVKIDSGEINYLIFNELNDSNIKGLVNGTISFQFEEIITLPIFDAKVLTSQPIVQENGSGSNRLIYALFMLCS